MPRKKSASKKAQETKAKEDQLAAAENSVKKAIEEEFESESESSSEDEDDFGDLLTEDVEDGFNKVLDAIKNNDASLLDSKVRFFGNPEDAKVNKKLQSNEDKPLYLKDYHRENLLAGNVGAEDDDEIVDENAPKTYAQEREEERNELLSEINNAFDEENEDEDDSEDDGFLKKKEVKETEETEPSRKLPDAEEDGEKFLLEFAKQNAWIPQSGDKIINLDRKGEDDDEFEEAAEKFEHAYNFRYEDPNSAEIVSYARNQATVRRNELTGRRKKREDQKQENEKVKQEKEREISKKKTEKVNKLTDILEQIKKEYGAEMNEQMVQKITASLLDKDFDDSQWDNLLAEIFNDEYYNDETGKPKWDDDDEIMQDFNNDEDEGEEVDEEEQDENSEEPPKKKSKKEQLKEKKEKKKGKQEIKDLAEKAIESNKLKIVDEVEEEREGRSKTKKDTTFKYREVSPETFGLTTREIFLADDNELNDFVGLKKLATYRSKEQRIKDRRKLAKTKNLRDWRKKVFKNPDGPEGDSNEIRIPVNGKKSKKSKKHSKKE